MRSTTVSANIASFLPEQAHVRPEQHAVVGGAGRDNHGCAIYERLTFAQLNRQSDALAWGLSSYGIKQNTRVLLMVPAGLPLIALTFALFKVGAVPILIDPAMGRQNLATCIAASQPEALVGVSKAHLLRLVAPRSFRTTRRFVTVGRRGPWSGATLEELENVGATVTTPFPIAKVETDQVAAVAFTTGSTGVPKGVVYEHGMFQAQCAVLRDFYGIEPGEVEMPAFPLFALFNVAMGVTSAIPPIDPTRPAACDPAEVVAFLQDQRVTSTFGSPAIWNKVSAYCLEHQIHLPLLKRVLMAGAPVPQHIHERFEQILASNARTHTPYGATEALPVASISGRDVIRAHAERDDPTAGTCVGWAVPGVTLRIIPIRDDEIAEWDDALALPPYEVGEIAVKGAMVTKTYLNRPEATRLAKIRDGNAVWHRMGDLGYLDNAKRLWFFGRKSHRVATAAGVLFTEPVERVFNEHPDVARSALVGVPTNDNRRTANDERRTTNDDRGVQPSAFSSPVIIIEPKPGRMPRNAGERERFTRELLELGARFPMTATICTVLYHPSFPVDIRHNAKIFREKLAVWAGKQLESRSQNPEARS